EVQSRRKIDGHDRMSIRPLYRCPAMDALLPIERPARERGDRLIVRSRRNTQTPQRLLQFFRDIRVELSAMRIEPNVGRRMNRNVRDGLQMKRRERTAPNDTL